MSGVGIFGKHGIHLQARASHACMHACMPSDGGLGRQVFTLALHTASSWPTERASCMHAFPSTRRLTAPIFGMHAQQRWPRSHLRQLPVAIVPTIGHCQFNAILGCSRLP